MASKQVRITNRMLFSLFLLAGFIFLLAPQNLTNRFQFAFIRIFRWPLTVTRNFSLFVKTQQPIASQVNQGELNKLINHLANLRQELLEEHKRLEKVSGLRNRFVWEAAKFVVADVITISIDQAHSELVINRGRDDGLAAGQFVLGENSVIGVISSVDSRTARIKLFTDQTSNIAVKLQVSDSGRIMEGAGDKLANVRMIKDKVKAGDDVFAAKKPGFLDTPVIIGKVAQCKRNQQSPLLWDITVKPVCDIEKLNDVAVIIMNPLKN